MQSVRICLPILALVILFTFSFPNCLHAQCTGGTNAGALSPNPATFFQPMTVTDGNYYTFTVAPSAACVYPTFTFSFCAADGGNAGYDTQLTILDNSGTPLVFNDDNCGLQSLVNFTPTSGGTYRVLVNQFSCATGGGNATLAYNFSPPVLPPAHPYFDLAGDASAGSGLECVVLNTNTSSQLGCAWEKTNPIDFSTNFSRSYFVNLGNNDGGADGMTFVMHNDPRGGCACGDFGDAIGAGGITNSLIIEIDTYLNTEDRDDGMPSVLCAGGPDPDHLDIWLNGDLNPAGISCPGSPGARIVPNAVALMDGGVPYNVENGLDHLFQVDWVAGTPGTLTATLLDASGTTTYGTISYAFSPLTIFGTNTPLSGFTAATGGFSNLHSFCIPPVSLPVDLLNFQATPQTSSIQLTWETTREENHDRFIIERAAHLTAQTEWTALTDLPSHTASGNSNQSLRYETLDPSPLTGVNFYRLRMIDRNGNTTYSAVEQANLAAGKEVALFPNPVTDELTLLLPHEAHPVQFRLFDLQGNQVLEKELFLHKEKISLSDLPAGLYFARIHDGERVYVEKLRVL